MSLKRAVWKLLGKDPEAVVVSFLSGPEPLARSMLREVQSLVPDREHFAVTDLNIEGITCIPPDCFPGPLRRKRAGLAPTLFTGDPDYARIRWLAFRYAPTKILAYNGRLERHHLQLRSAIASTLFLRGVPLDRIWLRPKWLFPFRKERSTWPEPHQAFEGRPLREGYPRVAVLTPYFPFPLSHGGAVRIFNLLREASRDYDLFLFSFIEKTASVAQTPVLDFCSRVVAFPNPRYREPRWASWQPPEVNEFYSEYVARILRRERQQYGLTLLQVEYTQLAPYRGEILVEHDVTFDLHQQVLNSEGSLRAWWDFTRWRRFERNAVQSFPRVVVMSRKDADLLGASPNLRVLPNGVDLKRFQPQPEIPGLSVLFVGSFRHFPNVAAFRWFVNEVWPRVLQRIPSARFVTIAGPNPELYYTESLPGQSIELHGFVSDVRPFYGRSNVVVVPTQVSAGTNLKVLEALACERAIISTPSGCAGLGLEHGVHIWVAEDPAEFAAGIGRLLTDEAARSAMARAGREFVRQNYDWRTIAHIQSQIWRELLTGATIRAGQSSDLEAMRRIQMSCHTASRWEPETYFEFSVVVAERKGEVCGFMVFRDVEGETEVLNLATAPESRRKGVATSLLGSLNSQEIFLEVRESNLAARKLYEKLGFVVVGSREKYYDDPVETAVVMRLSQLARA